jgi:hypothetical protein
MLECQSRVKRQVEKIQRIQIGKEEVKLSLFADDMILYLKDIKNSTKNTFSKVVGLKINTSKSVVFLYTKSEQSEK